MSPSAILSLLAASARSRGTLASTCSSGAGLGALASILLDPATPRASVKAACTLLTELVAEKSKKGRGKEEKGEKPDLGGFKAQVIGTPGLVRRLCAIAARDPTAAEVSETLSSLGIPHANEASQNVRRMQPACLACSCEAQDTRGVLDALLHDQSPNEKAASKCCTSNLSPLAVCAHTAINDPVAGIRIMELLLAAGADPNFQCDSGRTPLHWASTPAVARILLANGADPRIRDTKGRTALEYHRHHQELADFCAYGKLDEREAQDTDVARVIAAYERAAYERAVQVSSATLERSASRKIKRDDRDDRAGRTDGTGRAVSPDSHEEKAKRARTIA
jgi:hypothetical protein